MKSVEASAPTREEAIKSALDELGIEMYEADKIEILDEGSKGFLGLGARPVKVKVIVEHLSDEPEPRTESRDQGRDRQQGGRDRNRSEGRSRGSRPDRPATKPSERGGRDRSRSDRSRNDSAGRDNQESSRDDKPRNARGGDDRKRSDRSRDDRPKRNDRQRDESRNRDRGRDRKPREADNAASAAPPAPRENRPPRREEPSVPITDEQGNTAATLLEELIGKMGITAAVEFQRTDDDNALLDVTSEDGAILIGRKGRNLGALQYLVNRMVSRADTNESSERLVVDIEGYVGRRQSTLEDMARDFARRAKEAKRDMRLKPLSPQERRIIHVTLQGDTEIRTYSLGDSLYRSVVISPKNATSDGDRPPRSRSRGGRGRGGTGRSQRDDSEIDAGQFGD